MDWREFMRGFFGERQSPRGNQQWPPPPPIQEFREDDQEEEDYRPRFGNRSEQNPNGFEEFGMGSRY